MRDFSQLAELTEALAVTGILWPRAVPAHDQRNSALFTGAGYVLVLFRDRSAIIAEAARGDHEEIRLAFVQRLAQEAHRNGGAYPMAMPAEFTECDLDKREAKRMGITG